jgi:hypothetical protein
MTHHLLWISSVDALSLHDARHHGVVETEVFRSVDKPANHRHLVD